MKKYIICAGTSFIISYLITTFIIQILVVSGSSMEPAMHNTQRALINKTAYINHDPERFDIVVFPYENEYFIKRIIGLPGETVQIGEDGYILINNEKLVENYGKEPINAFHTGRADEPVILGEDEYFVMGDNRNDSLDSRFEEVGNINKSDIIGKVIIK